MTTMTIKEIQTALMGLGYDLGAAGSDGDAGPRTLAATTAFQKVSGLVADGIAGEKTQAALKRAMSLSGPAAVRSEPDRPTWLVLAAAMLGTKEGPGASNNPVVIKLFADAGFPGIKTDSTAWCAAFVNGNLERAGIRGSRSLAARSFESWGVGLKEPVLGCIATKKRAGSEWQGHTFLIVGANETHVFGLGGNQGDAVSIASFKRSEIVAYRWPAGVPIPTGTKLPKTVAGARSNVTEA